MIVIATETIDNMPSRVSLKINTSHYPVVCHVFHRQYSSVDNEITFTTVKATQVVLWHGKRPCVSSCLFFCFKVKMPRKWYLESYRESIIQSSWGVPFFRNHPKKADSNMNHEMFSKVVTDKMLKSPEPCFNIQKIFPWRHGTLPDRGFKHNNHI